VYRNAAHRVLETEPDFSSHQVDDGGRTHVELAIDALKVARETNHSWSRRRQAGLRTTK
jgi:hypothetical protein